MRGVRRSVRILALHGGPCRVVGFAAIFGVAARMAYARRGSVELHVEPASRRVPRRHCTLRAAMTAANRWRARASRPRKPDCDSGAWSPIYARHEASSRRCRASVGSFDLGHLIGRQVPDAAASCSTGSERVIHLLPGRQYRLRASGAPSRSQWCIAERRAEVTIDGDCGGVIGSPWLGWRQRV